LNPALTSSATGR